MFYNKALAIVVLTTNTLALVADTPTLGSEDEEAVTLSKVVAQYKKQSPKTKYQSTAGTISKDTLDSNPSGNGDITSILRILPNVQYDNAQTRSTTPGEIDPANISISGGLYYQNNFLLDGFNMNNDLDPIGQSTHNLNSIKGGRSQGLAVDTSLLGSIVVQDSNISAAYGGFSGGVVEANTRKARSDSWHANISYQITQGNANPNSISMTKYHIYDTQAQDLVSSSDESYQPQFVKHLVRASADGYATKNIGILASYSTTRSYIPLNAYTTNFSAAGIESNTKREQKREIDNYYIKAHYNPTDTFNLEASLAYIPQYNTYFMNNARNSYYDIQSGGWQAGLKAMLDTKIGLWTNTLGYSRLDNSRRSDANVFASWYYSNDKNWSTTNADTGRAIEGGYGDLYQVQNTLNYKSDMQFSVLSLWRMHHIFRTGLELNYQDISRDRQEATYVFGNPVQLIGSCGVDSLGLDSCSSVGGMGGSRLDWTGQYFNSVTRHNAGAFGLQNFAYGIYIEDDIQFNLGFMGIISVRPGLRLDGDNYMKKHTLAPRFSLNYALPTPKQYQTTLTFGANRYYGRNLFSYRLYDNTLKQTTILTRADANSPWVESTNGNFTSGITKFDELNVPYSDELVVGISQNLFMFNIALKYINRDGKDEIMRRQRNANDPDLPPLDGYATTYNYYTNDGRSLSDIITISIQNSSPIETFGIKHQYLFAFDWTNIKRTYNLFSADEAYYENEEILYNGQVIAYRDRPVENYTRPFTLRLTTTHSFNLWRTKWLWNNFFRYRAGYERMVLLTRNSPNYDPSFSGSQYGRIYLNGAFTWDMRLGFEINAFKGNTLYVNLDIYNVLNAKNMTTLSGTGLTGIASSAAVPVYEVGRQFWVQTGYKF